MPVNSVPLSLKVVLIWLPADVYVEELLTSKAAPNRHCSHSSVVEVPSAQREEFHADTDR